MAFCTNLVVTHTGSLLHSCLDLLLANFIPPPGYPLEKLDAANSLHPPPGPGGGGGAGGGGGGGGEGRGYGGGGRSGGGGGGGGGDGGGGGGDDGGSGDGDGPVARSSAVVSAVETILTLAGPARYCSPRHRMPFHSSNDCVYSCR